MPVNDRVQTINGKTYMWQPDLRAKEEAAYTGRPYEGPDDWGPDEGPGSWVPASYANPNGLSPWKILGGMALAGAGGQALATYGIPALVSAFGGGGAAGAGAGAAAGGGASAGAGTAAVTSPYVLGGFGAGAGTGAGVTAGGVASGVGAAGTGIGLANQIRGAGQQSFGGQNFQNPQLPSTNTPGWSQMSGTGTGTGMGTGMSNWEKAFGLAGLGGDALSAYAQNKQANENRQLSERQFAEQLKEQQRQFNMQFGQQQAQTGLAATQMNPFAQQRARGAQALLGSLMANYRPADIVDGKMTGGIFFNPEVFSNLTPFLSPTAMAASERAFHDTARGASPTYSIPDYALTGYGTQNPALRGAQTGLPAPPPPQQAVNRPPTRLPGAPAQPGQSAYGMNQPQLFGAGGLQAPGGQSATVPGQPPAQPQQQPYQRQPSGSSRIAQLLMGGGR